MKKMNKKKKIILIIVILIILAIIAALVVPRFLTSRMAAQSAVTSTTVTTSDIETTVTGSGNLAENNMDVTAPNGVTISDLLVSTGDYVSKGDPVAEVSYSSVTSLISDIKDDLSDIEDAIATVKENETETVSVYAKASARIKKIYAAEGDPAADTVNSSGSLMLLSLNGKMKVKITSDTELDPGDKVTVTLSDDSTKNGTVVSKQGTAYVITLTDKGTDYGDKVTVSYDGNEIGSGTLTIDEPMKVTNSNGTIKSIKVSEEDKVSSGDKLLTLTVSSTDQGYSGLNAQRTDLLNQLNELAALATTSTLYAETTGEVTAISTGEGSTVSDESVLTINSTDTFALNVTIDELDISSIKEGQSATMEIDAIENETFTGTVISVSDTAEVNNGVASFSATIAIDKTDAMMSGMNCSATIVKESKEDVLILPLDAVQEAGNEIFVYTSNDDGTLGDKKTVTTGLSDDSNVEITSGLEEGDTVYYTVMTGSSDDNSMMPGMMEGGNMSEGDFTMPGNGDGERNMQGGNSDSNGNGGGTPPSGSPGNN